MSPGAMHGPQGDFCGGAPTIFSRKPLQLTHCPCLSTGAGAFSSVLLHCLLGLIQSLDPSTHSWGLRFTREHQDTFKKQWLKSVQKYEYKCFCFHRRNVYRAAFRERAKKHLCAHSSSSTGTSCSCKASPTWLVLSPNCWHKYSNRVAHMAGCLILEIKTIE